MPVLVTCKFYIYRIKNECVIVSTTFFRRFNPKFLDGLGRNSNSLETLCLSWLPASLIATQSKMKALSCPQHFLRYKSMGKIVDAQGQETLE